MINLRKTRDLFLLLTLVVVLVVAVVLSRARLLQMSSRCTEGCRACVGDGSATEDSFSAPAPALVAAFVVADGQKRVAIRSAVLPPKTAYTVLRERVWRYAPKTSPPGFLA